MYAKFGAYYVKSDKGYWNNECGWTTNIWNASIFTCKDSILPTGINAKWIEF